MNVAVVTRCEWTDGFSERAEPSCATATECTICDRDTAGYLLTFSDA
jgi:hypothetical protein